MAPIPSKFGERFKCESCAKAFDTLLAKKKHIESDHQQLVCFMSQCGKRHKSAREMEVHFLKSHSVLTATKGAFKCDKCSQRFGSKLHLRRHIARVHYGLKSKFSVVHYCAQCDYQFTNPKDLKSHFAHKSSIVDTHHCTMEKDCDFESKSVVDMKKHIEAHPLVLKNPTNEPGRERFKCPSCVFSTKRKDLLQRHLTKKTQCMKPFTCDGCGKGFSSKKSMTKHQKNPCALTKLTRGLQSRILPAPIANEPDQGVPMEVDVVQGWFSLFSR